MLCCDVYLNYHLICKHANTLDSTALPQALPTERLIFSKSIKSVKTLHNSKYYSYTIFLMIVPNLYINNCCTFTLIGHPVYCKLKADRPHPRDYSTHRRTPLTDNYSSLLFAHSFEESLNASVTMSICRISWETRGTQLKLHDSS